MSESRTTDNNKQYAAANALLSVGRFFQVEHTQGEYYGILKSVEKDHYIFTSGILHLPSLVNNSGNETLTFPLTVNITKVELEDIFSMRAFPQGIIFNPWMFKSQVPLILYKI